MQSRLLKQSLIFLAKYAKRVKPNNIKKHETGCLGLNFNVQKKISQRQRMKLNNRVWHNIPLDIK